MKRNVIALLLSMAMVVSMIGGCGQAETTPTEEPAEAPVGNQEEVEAEESPAPEYEAVYYTAVIDSEAEEGGAYIAHDADTAYVVSISGEMPEDQKALFTEGAVLKLTTLEEVTGDEAADDAPTEDVIDEDASDNEGEDADAAADAEAAEPAEDEGSTDDAEAEPFTYGDPVLITAVAAEAVDEAEGYSLSQAVFQNLHGYTIEDMAETTMYAKSSVNVRSGPSTDNEVLGQLSFAQEVTMTGLTSTDWYRINYNDGEAYVSSSYLVMEKPVKQTASAGGAASGGTSTNSGSPGGSSAGTYTGRDYKTEYYAAIQAGDYELARQLMAESAGYSSWNEVQQAAGGSGSGGSGASDGGSSAVASADVSASLSQDFVNYLNSQRAAEGLSELAWDDGMASIALERAEEIVNDFSHNGSRGSSLEIIQKTPSADVSSWYTNFYNSSGHRASMLNRATSRAAAAFAKVGNYYYVIAMFD